MGNNGGKPENKKGKKQKSKHDDGKKPAPQDPKQVVTPPKPVGLSEADYEFLTSQTGSTKDEIKALFDKFMANNPDAKLDKKEFIKLYTELRPENDQNLDETCEIISIYL